MMQVFGIMEHNPLIEKFDFLGMSFMLIPFQKLIIIGSNATLRHLSEKEILKIQLQLFRFSTILPFQPYFSFTSQTEALNYLKSNYNPLKHTLEQIDGISEFQLFFDHTPDNQYTQKDLTSHGKAYFLKKYQFHIKEDNLKKTCPIIINDINKKLTAVSSNYEKFVATNSTQHLTIPSALSDIFKKTIIEVMKEYKTISLKLSGPWPPFQYSATLSQI